MKRALFISIIAVIVLGIGFNGHVSAYKNMDISEQIIDDTNAVTVEAGFSTNFEYKGDGYALCNEIAEEINSAGKVNKSINDNKNIYNIDIESGYVSGYIQFVKNEGNNIVEVQIKASDKIKSDNIRDIVRKVLRGKGVESKYFEYIKCNIKDGEIKDVYSKINLIFRNRGVKNIEGVTLDNGYCITAYKGSGECIQSVGKLIDINIAIISYKSGNYLIIGTPEIMTAY